MLETLELREKTAIELKYLGNTYAEISAKVAVPLPTINEWFCASGKLYSDYQVYVKKMNRIRDKHTLDDVLESDENVAKLTTNVLRQFAQQLMAHGKRLMVVDKDDNPVFDKDGKHIVYEFSKNLSVKDLESAWKIQRVLSGRHTDSVEVGQYDKEKVQEQIDEVSRIINAPIEPEK